MKIIDQLSFVILNQINFIEVGKKLKLLLISEKWSSSQLQEFQLSKLKKLISVARSNVFFWKQVIPTGNNYNKELGIETILNSLPILRKEVIREQRDKMWSKNTPKYIVATTGGTTGHPLTIRRDYDCQAINRAALWRARISWGVQPSQRTLYLNSFGKGTFLGRLRMRLANKQLGEAFPSSSEDVQTITNQIFKFKPKVLEGFATGLLETVAKADNNKHVNIPTIVSTGEMLYAHQRKLLEKHYSSKVYTYYGCNEIGSIAFECEKQQLHICEEHVIVETVDDNGNQIINKPGRVLVTDLDNVAMPFIRYELGDIAVISDKPCECGRSSKVITELIGRSQDYLSGINGQKLQATQLAGYLKDVTTTGQLQFIQDNPDKIVVLFNGDKKEATKELELIENYLIDRLGNYISVELRNVELIKKTKRGKQPLVVRRIKI